MASAVAQSVDSAVQELLHQQDRERALREQQVTTPDVRLSRPVQASPNRLPAKDQRGQSHYFKSTKTSHPIVPNNVSDPFGSHPSLVTIENTS